ncbi:MAG: DUF2442 domain-containing protein [Sulfurimonas sp.]|jgi:ribosomal protein S1
MIWVEDAKYIDNFSLFVKFNDGKEAVIDMEDYIKSKQENTIFAPLKELDNFKTVTLNKDIDTIVWANGADIAPERLYEMMENL